MATPARPRKSDARYSLRFAAASTLLVSATLVLALFVLPQRYVLSSGFREGSLVLPDPATPFEPRQAPRIAALPPRRPPPVIPLGPAETFWAAVIPLLDAERYEEAIALFTTYLDEFPDDRDARLEYARTLAAAGHPGRAIPVVERLLSTRDDTELRLLLARLLRDQGRTDAASVHYAVVLAREPDSEALWLEWARALAWVKDYEGAERVLADGLARHPDDLLQRAELARIYYYTGRLQDAERILSELSEAELRAAEAVELRRDVLRALTPPPEVELEPESPPSTLERALAAREAGDLAEAASLFAAALEERPDDAVAWQAYADFLQYQLEDFEGALEALKEVERLEGDQDVRRTFRMAQLEVWTGRTGEARARLEMLRIRLEAMGSPSSDPDEPPAPTLADVHALLGDLERWDGDRIDARRHYESALATDPDHEGAKAGMAAIRDEVDRLLVEAEQPHLGAIARSLADTDDFVRVDVAGDWAGLREDWVWGVRAGSRFVEGLDLAATPSDRQGLFAELEGARWWRLGTIRTALHGSVQTIRSGEVDAGVGASARLALPRGRRTDLRFDHEPAFGFANTLQSVQANVRQDRLYAAHTEPLGERWVAGATVEVASLDHVNMPGTDRNTRLQGALSIGRLLSPRVTLGLATRALHYRAASPDASGLPLYWDPEASVSTGPFVRWLRPLSAQWELTADVNPGVAWIQERATSGGEVVPDLSARVGIVRDGSKYRTSVELFYGQGRFTGYRSYGVNASFSARDLFGAGGAGSGGDGASAGASGPSDSRPGSGR